MKSITLMDMLQSGVHFGHQKSRRNPKMESYIYTTRGGISIIDLEKTAEKLQEAFDYVVDLTSKGGTVLFVSTKKQAAESMKKLAEEAGMPHITSRWLGGTFTNFETVHRRIKKYRELQEQKENGELEKYTKREQLQIQRDMEKMERDFGGIITIDRVPDAIFVVGVQKEEIAIQEANRRGITVIGLADTNCDPKGIDYLIPSNDDAVKSIELIGEIIKEAVLEGKKHVNAVKEADVKKAPAKKAPAKNSKDAKPKKAVAKK